MTDISKELRGYDKDYTTTEGGGNRPPDVESLADGSYTFEIVYAASDKVGTDNQVVVRVGLKIIAAADASLVGDTIEHTYWLNNQIAVNILGCDLATLGFEAAEWRGRFSSELMKLLEARAMVGIRFKGKKTTQKGDKKTFHKLYINWGLGKSKVAPGKPATPGSQRQPARTTNVPPEPAPDDEEEILF